MGSVKQVSICSLPLKSPSNEDGDWWKSDSLHHLLTTFIYLKSALVTVPILSPFVHLISEPYFNLSVRTLPARVLGEQDAGREVLGGGLF